MNSMIKKVLPNGVRLYLLPCEVMKKYYVSYNINYGHNGRWNKFALNGKDYHVPQGCAHFLEHMLGEHSKYGHYYHLMADRGYSKNGLTSNNSTTYYIYGRNDFDDSLKVIINMVDDPVFTEEDVKKTKFAIIEEARSVANNKDALMNSSLYKIYYKGLPLYDNNLTHIGDEESINEITYEDLKACYEAFYYDENKALVIAGNFDPDEMTNKVLDIYKELNPHPKTVVLPKLKDLDKFSKKEIITNYKTDEVSMLLSFKFDYSKYSLIETDYYLSFMMDQLLSTSTPFVKTLKKDGVISLFNYCTPTYNFKNIAEFSIGVVVNNKEEFLNRLINYFKTASFDKEDFDLYMKSEIHDELVKFDNKYSSLSVFTRYVYLDDNFDHTDIIKTLSFEKFLEFYHSLNFDNYCISLLMDSGKNK